MPSCAARYWATRIRNMRRRARRRCVFTARAGSAQRQRRWHRASLRTPRSPTSPACGTRSRSSPARSSWDTPCCSTRPRSCPRAGSIFGACGRISSRCRSTSCSASPPASARVSHFHRNQVHERDTGTQRCRPAGIRPAGRRTHDALPSNRRAVNYHGLQFSVPLCLVVNGGSMGLVLVNVDPVRNCRRCGECAQRGTCDTR